MRSQGIVVLGMHRSGTSMLAGLLHLAGAYAGDTIEPRYDNPKGFWEHKGVCHLDIRALQNLGVPWDAPLGLPQGWMERLDALKPERDAIADEFAAQPLWVLKEPRLCHLFSWWAEAFTARGLRLGIVLPLRHPLAVAASLAARSPMPVERALVAWCEHLLAAERVSRGFTRRLLDYEALLAQSRLHIEQLAQSLRMPLVCPPDAVLHAFADPSLHNHPPREKKPTTGLEALCGELYTQCVALAALPRQEADARFSALCQAARGPLQAFQTMAV